MQPNIRSSALNLGYINALPVTGHPFDVWLNRIKGTHLEGLSFAYDPVKVSSWPLEDITIWVAIAPAPPISKWPDGHGEICSHYIFLETSRARRIAWEDSAIAMGYEIIRDAFLPVRAAAIRAGLGVHGLNGLMIAPDHGSFIDISVLLVRAAPPKEAKGPEYDLSSGCCNCGACMRACPNGAISESGVNTSVCLRHYMNKLELLPEEDYPNMGRRILGCDTCQHACPSNANLERVPPSAELINCTKLEELLTKPTAGRILNVERYQKEAFFMSQAVLAAANTGRKDLLPLVEALTDSEDAVLSKMAKWAVSCLQK